jgi:hypothetical protein
MSLREFADVIQGSDLRRFNRFVPNVNTDECWEWQSVRNNRGYGKFWLNGRTQAAHRVSYRINNGRIPDGMQVRHTCDNPPCVNPAHLLAGTGKQNAQDAIDRGRYRRGVDNYRAKLTEDQVREIRRCWAGGETQVSMARRFGVSRAAVQWVINGRTWAAVSVA